jgi:hemerythrin-like domain-containing protein
MFVRLAQRKGGELDGEIEALRHQHEGARNYINTIASSIDGYAEGKPIPTSRLLENTAAYIALLRNHIHKEDHVFFPLVDELLTEEEHAELTLEFERAAGKAGEEAFEKHHKLVVDMGSMLVHM